MREENMCEKENKNWVGDIVVVTVEKVIEIVVVVTSTTSEDYDGNSEVAKVSIFKGNSVVGHGAYVKTGKDGEDRGKKYGIQNPLSYRPPPKPPDLKLQTITSGFPSDDKIISQCHGIKLHCSNLEGKIFL
ncbi:hypothetical protein V8G54_013244 [Vigna mungo]|uniref:Uncharacterized protein n=1 Tax=Vigna mungo TaxID=3915 RepID=A0AAQ3S447_VIGMU